MKVFYYFLPVVLVFLIPAAEAQTHIIKASSFFQIKQPGNIRVNEEGVPVKRPINKDRFIIITTDKKTVPIITSITYNDVAMNYVIENIRLKKVSAGKTPAGKVVIIKALPKQFLWKIIITDKDRKLIAEDDVNIWLKWKAGKKNMKLKIQETEIAGPAYY